MSDGRTLHSALLDDFSGATSVEVMRRVRHHARIALGLAALAGCAGAPGGVSTSVTLTRAGQAVVVTKSATRSRFCEFVTDLPLVASSAEDADAVLALRNAAGAAGGNLLLLIEQASTIERAEAYLCVE
jgi:hypothetical protein